MVFIRAYSIQDILRNINRKLTFYDISSLFVLLLVLVGIFFVIKTKEVKRYGGLTYTENTEEYVAQTSGSHQIFGSKSGKTYTYSWCQGAGRIKEVNKIYFGSDVEARGAGRTLSKLCK